VPENIPECRNSQSINERLKLYKGIGFKFEFLSHLPEILAHPPKKIAKIRENSRKCIFRGAEFDPVKKFRKDWDLSLEKNSERPG
jgi:hypothetical protein